MTPPTFKDFFKSFYYINTYVPPVDLSEQELSQYMLESEDSKTAKIAQQLISNPEVQPILSEPLSYEFEKIEEKNKCLIEKGFNLLGNKSIGTTTGVQKIPFYSVVEHEALAGWVIKSGAKRVSKDQLVPALWNDKNEVIFFAEEESILRIEMANRIAEVARKANIKVIVPKQKLVAYANLAGVDEVVRKYCVVCEKINILSAEETIQAIKGMNAQQQIELAKKISTLIQNAGLADASFENIRLTPEGELAFPDTEPAGLMAVKKNGIWSKFFGAKGASVEKCARIGLFTLMNQALATAFDTAERGVKPGLEAFYKQLKDDYEKISTPKLSKWKIALSVMSLGLIPLINTIVALTKTKLTEQICDDLQLIDSCYERVIKIHHKKLKGRISSNDQKEQLLEKHGNYNTKHEEATGDATELRAPLRRKFFAYIEGVPYIARPVKEKA